MLTASEIFDAIARPGGTIGLVCSKEQYYTLRMVAYDLARAMQQKDPYFNYTLFMADFDRVVKVKEE